MSSVRKVDDFQNSQLVLLSWPLDTRLSRTIYIYISQHVELSPLGVSRSVCQGPKMVSTCHEKARKTFDENTVCLSCFSISDHDTLCRSVFLLKLLVFPLRGLQLRKEIGILWHQLWGRSLSFDEFSWMRDWVHCFLFLERRDFWMCWIPCPSKVFCSSCNPLNTRTDSNKRRSKIDNERAGLELRAIFFTQPESYHERGNWNNYQLESKKEYPLTPGTVKSSTKWSSACVSRFDLNRCIDRHALMNGAGGFHGGNGACFSDISGEDWWWGWILRSWGDSGSTDFLLSWNVDSKSFRRTEKHQNETVKSFHLRCGLQQTMPLHPWGLKAMFSASSTGCPEDFSIFFFEFQTNLIFCIRIFSLVFVWVMF